MQCAEVFSWKTCERAIFIVSQFVYDNGWNGRPRTNSKPPELIHYYVLVLALKWKACASLTVISLGQLFPCMLIWTELWRLFFKVPSCFYAVTWSNAVLQQERRCFEGSTMLLPLTQSGVSTWFLFNLHQLVTALFCSLFTCVGWLDNGGIRSIWFAGIQVNLTKHSWKTEKNSGSNAGKSGKVGFKARVRLSLSEDFVLFYASSGIMFS